MSAPKLKWNEPGGHIAELPPDVWIAGMASLTIVDEDCIPKILDIAPTVPVARYVLADEERERLRDAVIEAAKTWRITCLGAMDLIAATDALEAYEAKKGGG